MRRRVQSGLNAGGAQSRIDHGARRAFPVRARDVNEIALPVRIAQCGQQSRDPVQPEFRRLDLVAQRVKIVNGLGVVHFAAAPLLRAKIARPASASRIVPPATFNSNTQIDETSGGGMAARTTAAMAISAPAVPAIGRPNLKPA